MKDLQLFQNDQFGQVRVVMIDGNPWFVAADVCAALEIGNVSKAVEGLDDDEKGITISDTPGGPQEMLIISEPGLYSLVLRSRKPEAKAFKRWITHEVVPSIRKTGHYEMPGSKPRRADAELNARCAAVSLRQMCRLGVYPKEMQAVLLAKSVNLLTGEPLESLLPPIVGGQEHWLPPAEIGELLGKSSVTVGKALKALKLHGEDDLKHEWSKPIHNKALNCDKQIKTNIYNPDYVMPKLREYFGAASDSTQEQAQ